MAGETVIVQVGNATADPELKYTNSGVALVSFTLASTPRTFDKQANEWKDAEALFLRCTAWREMAEHIAATVTKGMRLIVQGELSQRTYEHEGQRRTSYELKVVEVGPSLRYATAQVTRSQKGQGGSTGGFGGGNSSSPGNGVQGGAGEWASPGAEYDEPAPF